MKFLLALTTLLTTAVLMMGAGALSAVTYFDHGKIADALSRESTHRFNPDGSQIGELFTAPNLGLKIIASIARDPVQPKFI